MKFHRRIKNVIMCLDWIPNVEMLEMVGTSAMEKEMEAKARSSFENRRTS